jgi:aminoglycoside phosphotransferase (APT) family kinase protein
VLAPQLPVELPVPLALGEPAEGYPYPWTVAPWIPGATPDADNIDVQTLAVELGEFVSALQKVDPLGGPVKTGTDRGVPLAALDDGVRAAIDQLGDQIDGARVTAAWQHAVEAPAWSAAPVWIHGDLLPGNLLVRDRRLAAVIDFSGLGLGDPAPDIVPAWTIFDGESREVFRTTTGCDEPTWRRSMGWALAPALTGLDYYRDSVPSFTARSQHAIASVLDELG